MTVKATWKFNGKTKTIMGNWHWLWCLLFGPIYYLCKGMLFWTILSVITLNGLVIGFPLFNRAIVVGHFRANGWVKTRTR